MHALPRGYLLLWYEIESVLGQGGFGITYLARDVNLEHRVALKEFLPTDLATRAEDHRIRALSAEHEATYQWGLSRFLAEARTLARFSHPNIVRVLSVFEANDTAYMVMELIEGEGLDVALKRRRVKGEAPIKALLGPLIDGVEQVHAAGFVHRDIKPANIHLKKDGSPVLIDFGSARQAVGGQTRALTALVSPGYAPLEQYGGAADDEDKQGPWTDIYALGATLYRAVTGKGPVDAMTRVKAFIGGKEVLPSALEVGRGHYSESFLRAIDAALAVRAQDRPKSIAEWRRMLFPEEPVEEPPPRESDQGAQPADDTKDTPPLESDAGAQSADDTQDTSTTAPMDGTGAASGEETREQAAGSARDAPAREGVSPRPAAEAPSPKEAQPEPPPSPPVSERRAPVEPRAEPEPPPQRPELPDTAFAPPPAPPPDREESALPAWLRGSDKITIAVGCASIFVAVVLAMLTVIGLMLGICLVGGGVALIARAYRPEPGIVKGILAWLGGVCAVFTFFGLGYSLFAAIVSLFFAIGFLYASFAEDFLDI